LDGEGAQERYIKGQSPWGSVFSGKGPKTRFLKVSFREGFQWPIICSTAHEKREEKKKEGGVCGFQSFPQLLLGQVLRGGRSKRDDRGVDGMGGRGEKRGSNKTTDWATWAKRVYTALEGLLNSKQRVICLPGLTLNLYGNYRDCYVFREINPRDKTVRENNPYSKRGAVWGRRPWQHLLWVS